MVHDARQFYVRAEPSAAGRELLRLHQRQLSEIFADLHLNPRLTSRDDLHWTVLFLESPDRWASAFRALGAGSTRVSADDLLAWTAVPVLREELPAGFPQGFDVFYKGATNTVFVLRLRTAHTLGAAVLEGIRAGVQQWEREGKIPTGTTEQLFHHRLFPLARERNGGTPHVTLARGRVSRERQRDVLRTLRTAPLVAEGSITFHHAEMRIVGSPTVAQTYA